MGVKLVSSGGGSVEINPPATASNFVATMPAGTGNVVVAGINSAIVSDTAKASTSGTSIDFTGIPAWVKRITVMFSGVSTNGASSIIVQLGDSGGIETTGYLGAAVSVGVGAGNLNSTAGFILIGINAASVVSHGMVTISSLGSNAWVSSSTLGRSDTSTVNVGGGSKTLSDTLDRIRITTVNGTDTFDAGSINILYE
jgi:hypothetical protein